MHLVTQHKDNADVSIMSHIAKINGLTCDFTNCSWAARHWGPKCNQMPQESSQIEDWIRLNYFKGLMDQIHCHILHLYSVGLRVDRDVDATNIHSEIKKQKKAVQNFYGSDFHRFDEKRYDIAIEIHEPIHKGKYLVYSVLISTVM